MPTQLLENRFEIESQLSCTDFSTVYLGCDRRYTHKPACLITTIPYHQREIRHRLEREAQLLERLGRHPQIPRVLAFFHEANHEHDDTEPLGTFYIVQDQIEGHPISDEIKPAKKLSEGYVSKLIKDVLVALTFAHEQGLVHQNLHPQHLIREAREGQVFVTHFGKLAKIARSKIDADGTLGSSVPVGPSAYSAPEQLGAAGGAAGDGPQPPSDLYALGLIAIEALTGQRHQAFAYDSVMGLRWRESGEVSLHLAEFIDRMVRQDWRDRFSNAKEALETFRVQSDRNQIANDSRMKTVVAAPGQKMNSTITRSKSSYTGLTTRAVTNRANPYLSKLAAGSVAAILALGIGVKAYQWGEYRISLFPQLWQSWRSPTSSYPAAKAKDLTSLLLDNDSILLQPTAASAYWQMVAAAKADDIELYPLSGYLAPPKRLAKEEPSSIATLQQRSRQNDYATGYAIDIGGQAADLDRKTDFAQSPEFDWLRRNAKSYGFELSLPKDRQIGSPFDEPWHWRYVGDEASQKVFGL